MAEDTFAQKITDADDPFAGTDFGDFDGEPAGAEPPVVDREGNPVPADPAPQPAEAPAAATPPEAPQAAPAPAQAAEPQVGPTPEASAALDAIRGGEAPAADPTTTEASPGESDGPTEEPTPDPTPASSQTSPPEEKPAADESAAEGDAESPPETKDASGRTTKRRYIVLRVDGPGKFTQVSWYEDTKRKMVPRGPGAKRQAVALAKGTEEALKIGYAALGAPPEGVTLIAVAQANFQDKKVRPLPPEPSKQRLSIS